MLGPESPKTIVEKEGPENILEHAVGDIAAFIPKALKYAAEKIAAEVKEKSKLVAAEDDLERLNAGLAAIEDLGEKARLGEGETQAEQVAEKLGKYGANGAHANYALLEKLGLSHLPEDQIIAILRNADTAIRSPEEVGKLLGTQGGNNILARETELLLGHFAERLNRPTA